MSSKYQSAIDRINEKIGNTKNEKSQGNNKTSEYQEVIDRIRAKVNNDQNPTSDSVKKENTTASKYQEVIDRIRAKVKGEETPHTVPTVDEQRKQKAEENAPIKLFETKMEVLKHGMSASKAEQFKAWSDQQKSQEIKRGEASPSLSVQTTNALRTPSAKTQAVNDVEMIPGADISNLSGILANIHNLQNEIKDTEREQNKFTENQNNLINDLQHERDVAFGQGIGGDLSHLSEIDAKIQNAYQIKDQKNATFNNQISAAQDEIASLYRSLFRMSDFSDKSKYSSTRQMDDNGNPVDQKYDAFSGKYAVTGYDDVTYDYINKDPDSIAVYETNYPGGIIGDLSGKPALRELSNDEIGIYNYLYATSGKREADAFLGYMKGILNTRERIELTNQATEYAEKHPFKASIQSVLESPLKAVTTIGQFADYISDGKIDQNAAYNRFSYVPSAIRETVSKDIEKDLGEFWGPVGSFGYNVGMSMADFVTTTAVSGGNAVVSQIIMGSGAAADTVISAKDRGLNDDQAFALGVVAGLAEAVTEKYSIDALFKTIKAGKGAVVKHILKNMVTEGTEEVASSAINGFADIIVSQDESEWNKSIQNYMSEDGGGYSEDAAFGLALWDQVKSLGLDFVGGAISGAVMGGGSAALQSAVNPVSSQSSIERQLNKAAKLEEKQNAALDKLIAADKGNKIKAAAKFVNTVSKTTEKGINSVNASLDFIRNKEKQINNRIKEIDNAGTPSDPDQQEAVQKERAELQKQLDALKATDLMIRENRAEIEDARKRKENAEYVDPGEFDTDSDEDVSDTIEDDSDTDESDISTESAQGAETTETGEVDTYSAYAENAVKEALGTAQLNVAKAAKDLLKAYDGDLRAAVDALRISGQSINKGNSRFTRNDAKTMYAIDNVLRTSNAQFIGEAANNLRSSLSKYGITNVVVGGKDFVGYGNVGNKANYNRDTGVLTVSPYLDTREVLAAAVTHELTHHGAKYDLSLVNDAVSLIEGARNAGVISSGDLLYDNYEKSYRGEAVSFMRSVKGQTAVKSYVDGGMSVAEAQAQVIKDYINEELASDFLGVLLTQDTNSREFKTFSGQNRNVIQRILDAITGFIRRLKGENADANVKQYERTAEMLRDILDKGTGAETEIKDVNEKAGKKLSEEEVQNDSSLRYSIEVDTDGNRYVQVSGKSLEGIADTEIPKVLSALVRSKFNTWVDVKGQKIGINSKTVKEWMFSKDAKALRRQSLNVYFDKMNAFVNADELLKASKDYINEALNHERKDDFASFARGTVDFKVNDNGYTADIIVGVKKNGIALLYDVVNISIKKITESSDTTPAANATDRRQENSADNSIADSDGNVNTSEDNSDIRNAKDVTDVRSTEEKLRAENEYLKRQFMSRNGDEWAKAVSPEDVRRVSREIAKDLPGVTAGAVEAEFAEVVKVLQRKLTKDYSAGARYRDAMESAKAAAAKLIMQTDKVTVNNEWLDIRDLKKKLRDTKVYVSENVASEIPDWQSVRKEISGALSVVTTDRSALPLDSFYSELAEEYPEYFPAEIKTPQQQMERVIKVAKELKEIRQYTHETLWADAEDTGDTVSAETANSDLVQSFASVILAKYNESAMETLAAQLRREKDSQRWDSNSTRNMLAELQREIPWAQENAKQTIERHMKATRQKVNQFMALYNKQMDALKSEVEQANADAEWLSNRLAHHDERTKITTQRKRYSRNLKTLYNLLTKPTDKRHIPEGLQRAVVDLLSNFSGVKLDNGQTINPEVLRNLKARFSMDNGGDAVGALERLVNVVRLNKTSADFSVSDGFIDDLQRTIDLAKEILNEPKTLSKGELQDQIDYYAAYGQNYFAQREFEYLSQVNRVLSMVQKYINDSNKVFLGGKREYAADMADQVATEMRNRPKRSNVPANDLKGADNRPTEFAYEQMQADTFWHMFGDFGDMIMKSYRKAQNYQMEHEAEYADWMKKNIFDVFKNGKGKKYNTHDLGWGGELVTVSADGKKFEITRAQLMSCYVTWNQPEGKTHMTNGGVFFKNQEGEEVDSRHVVFTDESFAKLMEKLSEQDKAICDKVVKFLSIRGAAWGNEASMYLYGYKKFTRDYYFPIMAAKSALPVNWEQMTEFSKLESKGMTKARRGDAKNAILIDNFFDVADSHIRNMAAYSAFAPLNNDVRRIFDMGKAQSAVKSVLGDKTTGGKNKKMGGWGYLVDFLQNVDKNKVMAAEQLSSSKALRILSSMYKRQAVSSSLSSATKQPISYVRAWNVLDGKYLTMAFADKSFVPGSSEYKRVMKDMVDHSGVAKMKLLGYSDTGSAKSLRAVYDSNYSMLGDEFTNVVARGALKGYEKISDFFMFAAETMDKWTWIRLWKACELEVDAKNKGLNRYERMEAVAELFNQVIGETQVVDTVLDSTPALRNSDGLTQQMYAFMKEPIKTVNTVFRAWDDVKTGKKGAKKAMTKALVTFAVSNMILEPLISALFGMARDEEDEEGIFWQKLWNSMFGTPMKGEKFNLLDVLTSESVSSLYNTIPVVEEFADVLFSRLQGYDIERMDVSGLSKAIDSVVALFEYDSKKTKTFGNTLSDVVTSFSGLFGMPAYTLKRDVSAAFRLWYQWTDDYEAQWKLNKLFYNLNNGSARSQKNFYDIIGHVIREGDEDAYQYIREDLSNVFTSERKGLTANDMLKYMEDRKVEFDYTSRLWNIELQANFDLPQFVSNMQVEPMITAVYRKTNDSSVLPSPPSDNFKVKADAKFSDKLVWNSEKDEKEDSRTVMFKNQSDLAEYTEKVGDYAYRTLLCFVNSYNYKQLSDNQKAYAIKQVYKYSQAKYKTELYAEYDPNNKDYAKYIKQNASMSQVANLILKNARKQDK